MNRLQRFKTFVKENPYEAGFYAMTGIAFLALLRTTQLIKVANFQSGEIEKANLYMDRIVEAVRNGWEMYLDEENRVIDILTPESIELMNQVAESTSTIMRERNHS